MQFITITYKYIIDIRQSVVFIDRVVVNIEVNEKHKHTSGEYYAFFIIANMQVNKKEVTVNKHMPFNTTV